MVCNVVVPMVSWEMVLPVVKCHHKDVILLVIVMKLILTALIPALELVIALVVNYVPVENVDQNVVPIDLVPSVNFVKEVPVLRAVNQMVTVPLISRVLRVNVPILVPTKRPVDVMPYVPSRNIVCFVIVPMVMKVNPARNAYNLNANMMRTVNRINVAITVNVVILVWNMVPAVLMLSVVLSIVSLNAHVLPISLVMPPLNVNPWKVAVPIVLVVKIPSVLRYLEVTNALVWMAVLAMPVRVACVMAISSIRVMIKFAV